MRTAAFGGVGIVALLAIGAAAIAGAGPGSPDGQAPRGKSNFSVAEARSFADFPLYYAGDDVAGFSLTAVLREPINQTQETVSFIYGDCSPPPDAGCAPPVVIQIWPACVRNPSLYKGQRFPVPVPTSTRGAPAALFEGGHRLEIQTGISTVVIFGAEQSHITTVANELAGVNVAVRPGEKLPAAERAALAGTLRCK
jgi:hypothetical protein